MSLKPHPSNKVLRPHGLLIIFLGLIVFSLPMSVEAQDSDPIRPLAVPTIHIFQQGESLFSIAKDYRTTVDAILTANALDGAEDLRVGMRVVVPAGRIANSSETVTAQFGETFDQVALRFGVTRDSLGLINHIVNPTLVYAGQELYIPASSFPLGSTPAKLQRVAFGQSLWGTAYRLDVLPHELIAANKFTNSLLILGGQTIRIAQGGGEDGGLPEPWQNIELHPLPLEPGRTGSLVVETSLPGTITGSFLGNDLRVISGDSNTYISLLGIYRWTAPGIYPLVITFRGEDGMETSFSRPVQIAPGGYAQEVIHLSEEDAAVLADSETVQGEAGYVQRVMTGFSPTRLWNGLFRLPSSGIMSSAFGTARSYDGGNGYDTFHAGADLAAPTGTPIYAPAAGVVVDTDSLSVRGYATILDHGWGVYSGFWHQSGILVEPGDTVVQGQQIGTVGNTGLSTAAHVHWEMWVAGVQVDSLEWVREEFP